MSESSLFFFGKGKVKGKMPTMAEFSPFLVVDFRDDRTSPARGGEESLQGNRARFWDRISLHLPLNKFASWPQ